jgi:hypothetical protein
MIDSAFAVARKGDLVAVEERISISYATPGRRTERFTVWTLGKVASASRDGQVTKWFPIGWGDQLHSDSPRAIDHMSARVVCSAKNLDVDAVLQAAKRDHSWPGHPNQPQSFATLEELKAFVAPFLSTHEEKS